MTAWWPHKHPAYGGQCLVHDEQAEDGTLLLLVDQADPHVMVSNGLLRSIASSQQHPVSLIGPDGFGGLGSMSIHTPTETITYRLDRLCFACDAWEASRL